ncbi:MAG: sigma factor [Bradyrhizobium sp.]
MSSDNIAISKRDIDFTVLMTQAQAGDSTAYRRLLEEVANCLRSLGGYPEHDQHDAELLLQDILLTLHTLRHTYDPSRPFEPWLMNIARDRAKHYRARIKKKNIDAHAKADRVDDRDSDNLFGSGSSLVSAYASKTTALRVHWRDYVAKRNIGSIWTRLSKIPLI